MSKCYKFGEILLPKNADVKNWAVVACDQYTSDPGYWKKSRRALPILPPSVLFFRKFTSEVTTPKGSLRLSRNKTNIFPAEFSARSAVRFL